LPRQCRKSGSIGEFEKGGIEYATYNAKFEEIIENDTVVVPLFHYGCLWLFTNDFDVSRLTPTMGIIPFDQVGVLK
jgi:ABC-type oligopeptide transport system substrate-binding subunit